MNLTIIAPTYKRPEICQRFIESVPDKFNIVIVNLSPELQINRNKVNVAVAEAKQMPLTDAYNLGAEKAIELFPSTEVFCFTDDDVIFTQDTIIDSDFITRLLHKPDTGCVAITRIIHPTYERKNEVIKSHFVYKGGGYLINRKTYGHIKGFTPGNSADEWDVCMKLYLNGYVNYRTRSAYAYHKQGTPVGGYKAAIREGSNLGTVKEWVTKYLTTEIVNTAGYEYIKDGSMPNKMAKELHARNNSILRQ
jgi:glycosyltransferase involved in cell wall biosynthesis